MKLFCILINVLMYNETPCILWIVKEKNLYHYLHAVHFQVNAPEIPCLPYRFKWVTECLHSIESLFRTIQKKKVFLYSFFNRKNKYLSPKTFYIYIQIYIYVYIHFLDIFTLNLRKVTSCLQLRNKVKIIVLYRKWTEED